MTKERFQEIMRALDWTLNGLAGLLHRDPRLVRRWASGKIDVDQEVGEWLELSAKVCVARERRKSNTI